MQNYSEVEDKGVYPPQGLLDGAIDLHRHGFPEISASHRTSLDDVEDMTLCAEAGMRGVVLKSHLWPTVGRAYHLNRQFLDFEIYASITLNAISGGLSPLAVHAAAQQGARMVFLPTWSSHHDRERESMSTRVSEFLGVDREVLGAPYSLLDAQGKLTGEAKDVLRVAQDYGMALSTGHISPRESLAVAESGLFDPTRIVFSHPDSHSVGADNAAVAEMAATGCTVEICALGTLPPFQRVSIDDLAGRALEIGPERCVLTSDYFFEWSPPSAQVLAMSAMQLAATDLGVEGVRAMLVDTPSKVLRLQ